MGRKRNVERAVRLTVSMPQSAYERFEHVAKLMNLDVNSAIRMLASIQLISFEGAILKAAGDNPTYEQAQEYVRRTVPTMFPDKPVIAEALATGLEPEQERELVT